MAEYLIYFNQQWVPDRPEEWFRERSGLVKTMLDDMKAAGAYVFAGGLEEDSEHTFSADPTAETVLITDGPYVESKEYLGGFTVVDVPDHESARMWAARVAEACGWPQEVRRFGRQPSAG